MEMNIAIRVDASAKIGTGHMMRCLTLAIELKRCGIKVRFLCRHIPEHLITAIISADCELKLLDHHSALTEAMDSDWLGVSQATDAQDTINAMSDKTWDWLVVDNYALDSDWESKLHKKVQNIFVIDDLADRQHDCDVLLDQNFYVDMLDRYKEKIPDRCRLLLGPHYALLRDEFREWFVSAKPRRRVDRVLVFFGGVDALNYTTVAIEALAASKRKDLLVHVVIGLKHSHLESIKSLCVLYGFVCHVQTNRMAELIGNSDLAIGAGGSTCWECCVLGLPTLIVITAENQRQLATDLNSYGAALLVGDYADFSYERFLKLVNEAFLDQSENLERSKKALSLFPEGPIGVFNVVKAILGNE